MDDRLNQIEARTQAALIQFLNTDLDLAFTMLDTAMIEAKYDPPEAPAAFKKVRDAVRTVRALSGGVQNQTIGTQIRSRTDQLEAALDTLNPEH